MLFQMLSTNNVTSMVTGDDTRRRPRSGILEKECIMSAPSSGPPSISTLMLTCLALPDNQNMLHFPSLSCCVCHIARYVSKGSLDAMWQLISSCTFCLVRHFFQHLSSSRASLASDLLRLRHPCWNVIDPHTRPPDEAADANHCFSLQKWRTLAQ